MFSRRIIRVDARACRAWGRANLRRILWTVVMGVLCGAGGYGVSARWRAEGGARATVSPAAFAHRVRTAPMAIFDVTATPVTTVSAASFESVAVASESIVSAFGTQLATQTLVGADTDPSTPGVQLPTQLAGTTVEVNGRRAGLFFVSTGQVNYLVPAATETGAATVVVKSGDGTVSTGTVQVVPEIGRAHV